MIGGARDPWADRRTEPGDIINSARDDEIFLYIGILVVCVMIPADHIRECIITVCLRILCIVPLEKSPVREFNRFKIFLTKHHVSLRNIRGTYSFMRWNPKGR